MGALTAQFLNDKIEPSLPAPNLLSLGCAASKTFYSNCMVAKNASGYAVPVTADPALIVMGRYNGTTLASSSTAGAESIDVEQGAFSWDIASGGNAVTIADIGNVVYAQDDHTISKTDQGGTLAEAGILLNVFTPPGTATAKAVVQMGPSFLAGGDAGDVGALNSFFARAVITSIAAYSASGGVITASANGAIGAQDGVTLEAGNVVILPKTTGGAGGTTTAANAGPYVVTAVGTAGTPFVLTRPAWWAHGAGIPQSRPVQVGGEGTIWSGIEWKALCAGALVVGTGDPLMYPRVHKGTGAVGTQVTGVFARANAVSTAIDHTAAAAVKNALVAGNGTGTLDFTGTGTDAIGWTVTNF